MESHVHRARLLLAAAALAATASGAGASPQSIDLSTGASWAISHVDTVNQATRSGPAFTFDCLGNAAGPQCLSVTSTGFADGTWLPGADPDGFTGGWSAYVDFLLPSGATNATLFYELLGVDDAASLSIAAPGSALFVATAKLGEALPAGSLSLQGPLGAAGSHRLALDVFNGASFLLFGLPSPISLDDGTAVVGRFRVDFDLPGGTVPEPGSLASAGLALATALALRRRPRGQRSN